MRKFKYIAEVTEPTRTYNQQTAVTGDVLEFEGYVADKAAKDPCYKEITGEAETKAPAVDAGKKPGKTKAPAVDA